MPDRVFEALLEATGSLDWSSAEQVKRRGRQRARRRRVAVVAASLVLAFGVSGGMVSVLRASGGPPGQPSLTTPSAPTPTVAPTPAPSTSASGIPTPTPDASHNAPIPDAALLTEAEIAAPVVISDLPPGGDGELSAALAGCGADRLAPFVKQPTAQRARGFVANGNTWGSQQVRRRAGNASVQYVSQLTRKARACGPEEPTRRLTVVEEGFVGDASVLITTSSGDLHSVFVVFVAGGVEVELFFQNSTDKARARQLAGLLANRLG